MRNNNNFRLLYTEELQKINREIVPLFGARSRVESGSYTITDRRKRQLNIVVGETTTYKPPETVKKIGERVKKIMGVDEVYCFGAKLA